MTKNYFLVLFLFFLKFNFLLLSWYTWTKFPLFPSCSLLLFKLSLVFFSTKPFSNQIRKRKIPTSSTHFSNNSIPLTIQIRSSSLICKSHQSLWSPDSKRLSSIQSVLLTMQKSLNLTDSLTRNSPNILKLYKNIIYNYCLVMMTFIPI